MLGRETVEGKVTCITASKGETEKMEDRARGSCAAALDQADSSSRQACGMQLFSCLQLFFSSFNPAVVDVC